MMQFETFTVATVIFNLFIRIKHKNQSLLVVSQLFFKDMSAQKPGKLVKT